MIILWSKIMTVTHQEQAKKQGITIDVTQSERTATISVFGVIDEQGAAELKDRFEKLNRTALGEVAFNFTNASYIGSAGLGKLLLFYKKLSTDNIKMRVQCPSGTIRNTMMELKLDSLFTIS
jgi:anti-sigma B factor antagonist